MKDFTAYLKIKVREELKSKKYFDTVIHSFFALLICFSLSNILKIQKDLLLLFSFLGTFFPDIDHILLYKKKNFGNFKNFIKWIIRSDRHRVGFELFHNIPTIFTIMISLPYVYYKSRLAFVFFLSFLLHLITDLLLDKIIVKKIKWWRFGI
ncbi:MAG: metal-dependent hydrolase [Nanopusillaceae archaeon]